MRKLLILIWEAAVPPCVCAILTVVTYLTLVSPEPPPNLHLNNPIFLPLLMDYLMNQVNENYWDLMFQAILGKLYVISLFVTL